MKIHRGEIDYSTLQQNVITIGTFDGLHRAHQLVVQSIVELANAKNCESVLVTFDPHPRSVVYPKDKSLKILTDLIEKIERLNETKLDHLVIFPFSIEFSQQSAQEYIEGFIINKFKPKTVVVGFDHRFGLNRQGDFNLLNTYAAAHNFDLIEISKKESNQIKISSTAIRQALQHGNIPKANHLLGYRYHISGEVIKGNNIGTSLGYPTANIKIKTKEKLVPQSGIYAAFVIIQKQRYDGLLYIGSKPSLEDSTTIYIEVHVRDFEGYLYGEHIKIEFVEYVRDDEKFDDLEALKNKIKEDEINILKILAREKSVSI